LLNDCLQRIEDPIGLLPPKLILGINKRGVHFFRPVPKEYLHSAELRDIMQFGSSSQVGAKHLGALGAKNMLPLSLCPSLCCTPERDCLHTAVCVVHARSFESVHPEQTDAILELGTLSPS
jgi:hypothetical protein